MLLAISLAAVAVPIAYSGEAADPFDGTWVLNVAKSSWSPGPGPKTQTRVVVSTADGTRLTVTGARADGSAVNAGATYRFDGKDNPYSGNPDIDSIAMKRVDAHTLSGITKLKGKVVSDLRYAISGDGRILTMTVKGANADGTPVSNKMVFDRK
jgi:endonuclease YncB( thermonuclease family)